MANKAKVVAAVAVTVAALLVGPWTATEQFDGTLSGAGTGKHAREYVREPVVSEWTLTFVRPGGGIVSKP